MATLRQMRQAVSRVLPNGQNPLRPVDFYLGKATAESDDRLVDPNLARGETEEGLGFAGTEVSLLRSATEVESLFGDELLNVSPAELSFLVPPSETITAGTEYEIRYFGSEGWQREIIDQSLRDALDEVSRDSALIRTRSYRVFVDSDVSLYGFRAIYQVEYSPDFFIATAYGETSGHYSLQSQMHTQHFEVDRDQPVAFIGFNLARVGSPTGTLTVTLKSGNSGGSTLASADIPVRHVPPNPAYVFAEMKAPVLMDAGPHRIEITSTGFDASNYVQLYTSDATNKTYLYEGTTKTTDAALMLLGTHDAYWKAMVPRMWRLYGTSLEIPQFDLYQRSDLFDRSALSIRTTTIYGERRIAPVALRISGYQFPPPLDNDASEITDPSVSLFLQNRAKLTCLGMYPRFSGMMGIALQAAESAKHGAMTRWEANTEYVEGDLG